MSEKLRKLVVGILLAWALLCGVRAQAQYNREYFFWVGRSCMMNNDYQEAIRTLNTLLRFDEKAYEGYFLRGIAKYNLDDLLGAEADFSTAIRMNPVYTQAYTCLLYTSPGVNPVCTSNAEGRIENSVVRNALPQSGLLSP